MSDIEQFLSFLKIPVSKFDDNYLLIPSNYFVEAGDAMLYLFPNAIYIMTAFFLVVYIYTSTFSRSGVFQRWMEDVTSKGGNHTDYDSFDKYVFFVKLFMILFSYFQQYAGLVIAEA